MQLPDLTQARWRVSARTNGATTCVEAATDGAIVALQNSTFRHPEGPVLTIGARGWSAFLGHVAEGRLDRTAIAASAVFGPFLVGVADDGWIEVRRNGEADGPVVRYTPEEWDVFVAGVAQDGEFSLQWLLAA